MLKSVALFFFLSPVFCSAVLAQNVKLTAIDTGRPGMAMVVLSWNGLEAPQLVDYELLDPDNMKMTVSECPSVLLGSGHCVVEIELESINFYGWQQNTLFVKADPFGPFSVPFEIEGGVVYEDNEQSGLRGIFDMNLKEHAFSLEQSLSSLSNLDVSITVDPFKKQSGSYHEAVARISFYNSTDRPVPLTDGGFYFVGEHSFARVDYNSSTCLSKVLAPGARCVHHLAFSFHDPIQFSLSVFWVPLIEEVGPGVRVFRRRLLLDEEGWQLRNDGARVDFGQFAIPIGVAVAPESN